MVQGYLSNGNRKGGKLTGYIGAMPSLLGLAINPNATVPCEQTIYIYNDVVLPQPAKMSWLHLVVPAGQLFLVDNGAFAI